MEFSILYSNKQYKISFGYGSRHDMRTFFVAICDDCITQLETSGLAIDFKLLKKEENKHFKRIINPENE